MVSRSILARILPVAYRRYLDAAKSVGRCVTNMLDARFASQRMMLSPAASALIIVSEHRRRRH